MTSIPSLPQPPPAAPGSYARGYPSLEAFLADRPERRRSREHDVGTRWRDGAALYRAAWIADTRELYLVQLGPATEGGGHVELLASDLEERDLDRALRGWREAQDTLDESLAWLRARVAAPRRRRLPVPPSFAWHVAALAACPPVALV